MSNIIGEMEVRRERYDVISEQYEVSVCQGLVEERDAKQKNQNISASMTASEESPTCHSKRQDHVCGSPCKRECKYTPKKSAIYHKINAAYCDSIENPGITLRNGTCQYDITYEKMFEDGIQSGDWIYYSKGKDILSSEIYRKGIPIQNHAYYPNGKIACVMTYDTKTYYFRMLMFDPAGTRVFAGRRKLELSKSRGTFELHQVWHPSGHMESESPMYQNHNFLEKMPFKEGQILYGVRRKWHSDGRPESEIFVFNSKNLFSRRWSKTGEITCHWMRGVNEYKECPGPGYNFVLNGVAYNTIEWKGNSYMSLPINTDNTANAYYRVTNNVLIKTCSVNGEVLDMFCFEPGKIKYAINHTQNTISSTHIKKIYVYKTNDEYLEYQCVNGYIYGKFTNYVDGNVESTFVLGAPVVDKLAPAVKTEIISLPLLYGVLNGVKKTYSNGKLIQSDTYYNGYKNGKSVKYIGRIQIIYMYKNDVEIRQEHYENNKCFKEIRINKNVTETIWYENSEIKSRTFTSGGKLNGIATNYSSNGSVRVTYVNDQKHGSETTYSIEGNVTHIAEYYYDVLQSESIINNIGKVFKFRKCVNGEAGEWEYT